MWTISGSSVFLDAAFQEAIVWNIAGRESDEAQAKLMSVREPSFGTQTKWPHLLELTTTTGLLIALMALCEEQMHSAINSHLTLALHTPKTGAHAHRLMHTNG